MKRRFSIIPSCGAIGDSYACTYVNNITSTELTCIGHTAVVGDYVLLTGEGFGSASGAIVKVEAVFVDIIVVELMGITEGVITSANVVLLNARRVYPLNFRSTSFVYEKDRQQPFFTHKLQGPLKFTERNGDFDYLVSNVLNNRCCPALLVIEKRCSGEWVEEYKGLFTHADIVWNMSHCEADLTLQPYSIYSCLDANKSDKVNFLPVIEKQSVDIIPDSFIEYRECCVTGVTLTNALLSGSPCYGIKTEIFNAVLAALCGDIAINLPGWSMDTAVFTNITGSLSSATADVCVVSKRQVYVTLDSGGSSNPPAVGGGGVWTDDGAVTIGGQPAHRWVRKLPTCLHYVDMINDFPGNPSVVSVTCTAGDNLTITYSCGEETPVTYDDGRNFGDVLTYVVKQTCGKVAGIKSDFFEINPPGDTPGYSPGVNYVTGDDNVPANLLVFQKSDFLNPDADESATIGEVTFEDLMNWLRTMFNAYWFIDGDNYLRIEHYSWFSRTATIDVTQPANFNRRINAGRKSYKFDKDTVPIREEFTWMEANSLDFLGLPIKYSGNCANKDRVDNYAVTNVTTDVAMMQNLPDQIDLEGFAIIALDPLDTTKIHKETGLLTGVVFNNAHLSWANLHYNYHRHGRPLISGNMNGADETFLSAQRKMKGNIGIEYRGMCCDTFNPLTDMVTTELGDGEVQKIEVRNSDEVYKFDLNYE